MRLLRIDSSARTASVTRQLTARFAEEWKMKHPNSDVMLPRPFGNSTLPLITDDWSATNRESVHAESCSAVRTLPHRIDLIEEPRAAETIVIGAPMYNFSIPSSLKAWIDQIVRIGKTFSYGSNGLRGLLRRKRSSSSPLAGGGLREGHCRRSVRFSGTLSTERPRIHWAHRRNVCPRRKTSAGRKPARPSRPLWKKSPSIVADQPSLIDTRNFV